MLQIAQEEEAGIQSTQEEFEFIAVADAYEETKSVKVNCTSEDTLQQASTSGTRSNNAQVYDLDGSTKIAQEEEAGIQSTQEEFEFIAVADAYEETKSVKVNCTSEDTLQQASTSGTRSNNAQVYDLDGSTKVIQTKETTYFYLSDCCYLISRYDSHDVNDRVGKSIQSFVRRIIQMEKIKLFQSLSLLLLLMHPINVNNNKIQLHLLQL
nr:hypothetical protein [Tanacetum cinerariifolium]